MQRSLPCFARRVLCTVQQDLHVESVSVKCVALQVLFSSSVMYGNFVTIAQRRAIAKEAQEHKDRSVPVQNSMTAAPFLAGPATVIQHLFYSTKPWTEPEPVSVASGPHGGPCSTRMLVALAW